jgi:hypothetical protein
MRSPDARPSMRPQALFVGFTTNWLQVHGGGSPPSLPPTEAFYGDGISVTLSAISGGVRFTARGPNSAGVATELLLQPLVSSGRAGQPEKYRTRRSSRPSGSCAREPDRRARWWGWGVCL